MQELPDVCWDPKIWPEAQKMIVRVDPSLIPRTSYLICRSTTTDREPIDRRLTPLLAVSWWRSFDLVCLSSNSFHVLGFKINVLNFFRKIQKTMNPREIYRRKILFERMFFDGKNILLKTLYFQHDFAIKIFEIQIAHRRIKQSFNSHLAAQPACAWFFNNTKTSNTEFQ